ATPVATLSGAPIMDGSIDAFAFDSAGRTLFAVNLDENPNMKKPAPTATFLVTVDPVTGAITTRGPSVPGLDAIAFGPEVTPVPEPAALSQVAFGLLTALGCGWWRVRAARVAAPGENPRGALAPVGSPAAAARKIGSL